MEHKLVQGGDEYLPFARSRIKALRATGLKYASQAFDIEGAQVRVRIAGDQEYIEIQGGGQTLRMDSGIVDVGITNEEDDARFLPGRLIKPAPVLTYDAAFTKESTAPWWTNPNKSSAGQLSGEITGGTSFRGRIRKDGVAKSFAPKNIIAGDPPEKKPDPADSQLVDKKKASDLCPPSMFTGRARLYAQALFGQYLYRSDAAGAETNSPPGLILSAPPMLRLSLHKDGNAERAKAFADAAAIDREAAIKAGLILVYPDPYFVTLNINSGVYLDPVSGKHWLLNPTKGGMKIYPLISSPAGESLRKWLKPAMAGKLNEKDRDHLEAYILSACRPHVELVQKLALDAGINPYSMGYGWHWNWSGTQADMVQNLYDFVRDDKSSVSTHYRLSATANYDAQTKTTTWSAGTAIVEGPVSWLTLRPRCCFTEPSWLNRSLVIGHPPVYWSIKTPYQPSGYTPLYNCNAPIYAFYRKDELVVCRYSAVKTPQTPAAVSFTPGYAVLTKSLSPFTAPDDSYIVTYETTGLDSAFLEHTNGVSEFWTFSVHCGGDRADVIYNKVEHTLNMNESAKGEGAGLPGYDPTTHFGPGLQTLRSGRPAADGTYTGTDYPGWSGGTDLHSCSWDSTSHSEARSTIGVAGGIVPFYDAEAFYLLHETQDEVLKTSRTTGTRGGVYIGYDHGWRSPYPFTDPEVPVGPTRYEIKSFSRVGGVITNLDDELTVSGHVVELRAFYRGGAITGDAIPSDVMSMFDDGANDYVGATFKTLSSASPSKPLLHGLLDANWPSETIGRPAIVGWA